MERGKENGLEEKQGLVLVKVLDFWAGLNSACKMLSCKEALRYPLLSLEEVCSGYSNTLF